MLRFFTTVAVIADAGALVAARPNRCPVLVEIRAW